MFKRFFGLLLLGLLATACAADAADAPAAAPVGDGPLVTVYYPPT